MLALSIFEGSFMFDVTIKHFVQDWDGRMIEVAAMSELQNYIFDLQHFGEAVADANSHFVRGLAEQSQAAGAKWIELSMDSTAVRDHYV